MLYAPIHGEVETDLIRRKVQERGGRLLYPRVEGESLGIYEVRSPECDLTPGGRYRIPEPNPESCRRASPGEIDLVVVPGVVFDVNGFRIGYGKGFYDRFIGGLGPKTVCLGIGYEFQMIRNVGPGKWDHPLMGVVSDREFYKKTRFEFVSNSADETRRLAGLLGEIISRSASSGKEKRWVLALIGDLGTGKTCFVQGLAMGLHCKENPVSPTFTLVREYVADLPIRHVDLYRLDNSPIGDDALFFEEVFQSPGIVAIEWAERYWEGVPLDAVLVNIERLSEEKRIISFDFYLERHRSLVGELALRAGTGGEVREC
jgi:5,10-methenyltetrahydrofolate synthetase/tRNA threonylcarbamoyl adenosine modification protein YjeE